MTTQPLSALTMLLSRHTRRRDFIALLGGAAAAWPLAASAQQAAMPVIGLVSAGSPQGYEGVFAGFLKGLDETGYVEGDPIAECKWRDD